jgi:uncharacterized membrane protein
VQNPIVNRCHGVVVVSYLALLIWQPTWHTWLPAPHGAGIWWLGLVAALPLLLPLRGVLAASIRSMTWAGYLLLLYLIIGVMEAWSNPAQRESALVQTSLVILCICGMLLFSRDRQP